MDENPYDSSGADPKSAGLDLNRSGEGTMAEIARSRAAILIVGSLFALSCVIQFIELFLGIRTEIQIGGVFAPPYAILLASKAIMLVVYAILCRALVRYAFAVRLDITRETGDVRAFVRAHRFLWNVSAFAVVVFVVVTITLVASNAYFRVGAFR